MCLGDLGVTWKSLEESKIEAGQRLGFEVFLDLDWWEMRVESLQWR